MSQVEPASRSRAPGEGQGSNLSSPVDPVVENGRGADLATTGNGRVVESGGNAGIEEDGNGDAVDFVVDRGFLGKPCEGVDRRRPLVRPDRRHPLLRRQTVVGLILE